MMTKHSMHLTPAIPGRLSSLQGQEEAMVGLFIHAQSGSCSVGSRDIVFYRLKWYRMLILYPRLQGFAVRSGFPSYPFPKEEADSSSTVLICV